MSSAWSTVYDTISKYLNICLQPPRLTTSRLTCLNLLETDTISTHDVRILYICNIIK